MVGELGIKKQRRFITEYFNTGQQVLFCDDDIETIEYLQDDKLNPITNLDEWIKNAFYKLKEQNLFLFGIYPVRNAFFMNDSITKDLRFILGTFYGVRIRHDSNLYPDVEEKEDVEQSILYIKKMEEY